MNDFTLFLASFDFDGTFLGKLPSRALNKIVTPSYVVSKSQNRGRGSYGESNKTVLIGRSCGRLLFCGVMETPDVGCCQ